MLIQKIQWALSYSQHHTILFSTTQVFLLEKVLWVLNIFLNQPLKCSGLRLQLRKTSFRATPCSLLIGRNLGYLINIHEIRRSQQDFVEHMATVLKLQINYILYILSYNTHFRSKTTGKQLVFYTCR